MSTYWNDLNTLAFRLYIYMTLQQSFDMRELCLCPRIKWQRPFSNKDEGAPRKIRYTEGPKATYDM